MAFKYRKYHQALSTKNCEKAFEISQHHQIALLIMTVQAWSQQKARSLVWTSPQEVLETSPGDRELMLFLVQVSTRKHMLYTTEC